MRLYVKGTDDQITGTLEVLYGRALAADYTADEFGTFKPDYEGGTEVFWDEQETVCRNGSPVYLNDSGEHFTADQVEFRK